MKAWALPLILSLVALPATAKDACEMANQGGPDGAIVERACRALEQRELYRRRFAVEADVRARAEAATLGSDERLMLMREWEEANALLDDARREMSKEMNGVISDTLVRYGIAPVESDGDITGGPGKGLRAHWEPRYKMRFDPAHPLLNEVKLKNGQFVYLKWEQGEEPEARAQAFTWLNGRVDILDEAFEKVYQSRRPGMLGFLLHHESIHFDQLRNGGWKTENLREVAAYTESIKAAPRFGLNALELEEIKDKLLYNQARVDAQRQRRELAPRNLPPPDVQARNKGEWDEFVEAQRLMQEGRDNLEKDLKDARDARANDRDAANSGSQSAPWTCWQHLQSSAKLICEFRAVLQDWMAPVVDFARCVREVHPAFYDQDRDEFTKTMPCEDYVLYQGIYAHRHGVDTSKSDIMRLLAEEGKIRETDPRPRRLRFPPVQAEPTPPPSATPPPPPNHSGPVPVEPEPAAGRHAPTPSVPHCRFHPWCKG